MKRRTTEFGVWPAIADLMSALAVVGIAAAVAAQRSLEDCVETRTELEQRLSVTARFGEALTKANGVMSSISRRTGRPLQDDQTLVLGDELVHFEINSADVFLSAEAKRVVEAICDALRTKNAFSDVELAIEGHTDGTTCRDSPGCNDRLSAARAVNFALEVEQICRIEGVRYLPIGMGFQDPARFPERTRDDRSANRRIKVRIQPNYQRLMGSAGSARE